MLVPVHKQLYAIVIEESLPPEKKMRSVYEPSNAIQAHVLQDVLRQHGIASHVQGEHLQGAIGELPAGSLVRLLVDEADYEAARRALQDWERAEPMDEDELASLDSQATAAPASALEPESRFSLWRAWQKPLPENSASWRMLAVLAAALVLFWLAW